MSVEPGKQPRSSPSGPEVPGYKIEGEIGRGATGVVYRARQVAVGREVALKVLHRDLAGKPRVVRRLQREARTTARLSHPHIVAAIDMGLVEGLWWYAMELVDGSSLALALRQEGRLSERRALRLFIPLCEALQHAWEQGVVHRDIKPSNILLDRAGNARLADFGLAFRDDDPLLTSTGDTLGTPHFISPEQARDSATVDIRSDIWSLGATMFTAVTGRPPFAGESVAEVLSGVLYAQIPDPRALEPSLSAGFALVLRKCLAREPEHRYQTPRELLLDLERVRERRQPKVARSELDPVVGEADPTRVYVVAASVVLAALLVVVLAVWRPWSRGGPRDEPRGEAVFAPLQALRTQVLAETDAGLAAELLALEELRPDVPTEHLELWRATRTALRARARAQVEAVRLRAEAGFDEALAVGDFAGAERALEDDLRAELAARTGFRVETVPADLSDLGTWHALRRRELEAARAGFESRRRQLASYAERTLVPRVDRLEREGRWREAFAALAVSDDELLADARVSADLAAGKRTEDRAELLAEAKGRVEARRAALAAAWEEIDARLVALIARQADRYEAELAGGTHRLGAAESLIEDYDDELDRRGLDRERLPLAPSPRSLAELQRRGTALFALEERVLARELESRFRDLEAEARELLAAREYAVVGELWHDLAEEVRSEAAAHRVPAELRGAAVPAADWTSPLLARIALRREEAAGLNELLERAAAGVRALNGEEVSLFASAQKVRGRLVAGPEPLTAGFRIVSNEGAGFSVHLQLQRVRADELERKLVGWPERGEDMGRPEDRLLRALFRFHEGDWEGARTVLASGPLPADRDDLSTDLLGRIQASMELERRNRREHARVGGELLALLYDEGVQADPESRSMLVDSLLRDYADVPEVGEEVAKLRAFQKQLKGRSTPVSKEDFELAYGPESVELLPGGRVRLSFDFTGGETGRWSPGSWIGWSGSPVGANWDDVLERPGPSLELVPPLDLDGGLLEVEAWIEQPAGSGPPALFVLSVAGYHAALVGSGLPGVPEVGAALEGGTIAELLAGVRGGDIVQGAESYLKPGVRYRVRLRVDLRRRTASLALREEPERGEGSAWREVLARGTMPDPIPSDGARRVVLRSWESLRLLEARLQGTRQR